MQDEAKRRGLLCDVCDEAKDTGMDDVKRTILSIDEREEE